MTTCPSCGHDVPDRANCANCGAQLTSERHGEERRTVTTLFCDLVGFTALSQRNDPEVVKALLRRYYATARHVIESYGGVVEKSVGDRIVAIDGTPKPCWDGIGKILDRHKSGDTVLVKLHCERWLMTLPVTLDPPGWKIPTVRSRTAAWSGGRLAV
jgi:class 3 adenylate cyclase